MADIYLCYSPVDQDAVAQLRHALVRQGFELAVDDVLPRGVDPLEHARDEVSRARCVVVAWSEAALASYEVQRVARFATNVGKLVSVEIEALGDRKVRARRMDAHSPSLVGWDGDDDHPEWARFLEQVESKIPSIWTLRRWAAHDRQLKQELEAERSRREELETELAMARSALAANGALAAAGVPAAPPPPPPVAVPAAAASEQIFISYASVDRQLAARLAEDIVREGYTVWWDTQLLGGEQYRRTIVEKLAEAQAAFVLWTAAAVESDWVYDEASRARKAKKLIPIRHADLDPDLLPPPFGVLHTVTVDDRRAILLSLLRLGVTPLRRLGEAGRPAV